jgi:hypothetical protein
MAFRKSKTNQEAQPILAQRRNNTLEEATVEQQSAVAGLVVTCLSKGNACYCTPGRFGGVQFKVYVEGDQFAEYLEVNEKLPDLVEEIIEALYDLKTVAWYRQRFGARRDERPSKPRGGIVPASGTGEEGPAR